jgi:hypothetical protein
VLLVGLSDVHRSHAFCMVPVWNTWFKVMARTWITLYGVLSASVLSTPSCILENKYMMGVDGSHCSFIILSFVSSCNGVMLPY